MITEKDKVFLAPHNDDEVLFGGFTLIRERPLVVLVTDSFIQEARGDGITADDRREETLAAMGKLGLDVEFLEIRDDQLNKTNLVQALEHASDRVRNAKLVFAPMIEGDIPAHDVVGEVAHEMFENVLHYSTYTKDRPYPHGDIPVVPIPSERVLKNELLEYYTTQKNHPANKIYFQYAKEENEYFNSSRYPELQVHIKEHALRNLIIFKHHAYESGIPFTLMDGLLLGAYREGDFIVNDEDDLDIGIDDRLIGKIPILTEGLIRGGFKFVKKFELNGKFEGATVDRNGSHIDYFLIHKKDDVAYNLARNALPNPIKPYMSYVYPRSCFEDFDRIIFKGMKFNIPFEVEKFLTARYGNWQTPIHRKEGFDWLNISQNPCLTQEFEI